MPLQLLLIAATVAEIQPFLQAFSATTSLESLGMQGYTINTPHCNITVCIGGAGILHTAYHLSRCLQTGKYHCVLQAGIAGSFNPNLKIGAVVEVISQQIADLGAEDHQRYLPITQMPFYNPNEYPYQNGVLVLHREELPLPISIATSLHKIPKAKGITVNTVSGRKSTIALRRKLFNPDIEEMEGAAFFYTCLMQGIAFAEVRAISNYVEPRNTQAWNIALAVDNLCSFLSDLVLQTSVPDNL